MPFRVLSPGNIKTHPSPEAFKTGSIYRTKRALELFGAVPRTGYALKYHFSGTID